MAEITSRDVAKRAGVSQSAVSRVFTPGASVSAAMEARVREAADALGYRPNTLARGLITGRSRVIGVVVAYLENQFYPTAIEKLSIALQARGYHTLIFMASNAEELIDKVIDEMLDHRVDGIVMASVGVSNTLAERCEATGIPVVLFNRSQRGRTLSSVTSDNKAGGRKVAKFLLACGHQRIAHIAGWQGSSTGRDREAGFRAGLTERNQPLHAYAQGDYDRETAMRVTREMFSAAEIPDAVFVGNDHMAFGVLDVLRLELGLHVPDEVAVVGYDDTPVAAWPAYGLTTIRQRLNRMVVATVDALLVRIEQKHPKPVRIRIEGPLIRRTTTRSPIHPFEDPIDTED